MTQMPTLFLSHGSPMHAIESGRAGEVWAALGKNLPKPKALVVATAHWESNLPMLSGSAKPPMIYDFGGFPDALYKIRYPAPGAPALAAQAQDLLKQAGMTAAVDGCRGYDHGTWVPLLRMYPEADVPVVQLSVQTALGPRHHFNVGRALASLREEGVLIIGSGHLTHNLREAFTAMRTGGHAPGSAAYVHQFQTWMAEHLDNHDIDALLGYREQAPEAARAHPTEEHFLPLFIALGAAGETARVEHVFDGLEWDSLAMDAYAFH
jgi:4,5-DOPA dioxygenase extradiol